MQSRLTWILTYARECEPGWYSVELERVSDGLGAVAVLEVTDRGGRHGQPADWRVYVESCDDEAREWLEAAEHEYALAEAVHTLDAERSRAERGALIAPCKAERRARHTSRRAS